MTTNAGPEYLVAEARYQEAQTDDERLMYLRQMLQFAPKHKGSENLRAEMTKKIAKLQKQIEKAAQKKGGGKGQEFQVKKDGCGQIAVVGLPNSGKSLFVKTLTGIETVIAPFPFATKIPIAGMMDCNHAKVQLVDVPALMKGSSGGKNNGTQLLALVRNADAVCAVVGSVSAREELGIIVQELKQAGIIVTREKPKIEFRETSFKGITIAGKRFLQLPEHEFIAYLKSSGIYHASVVIGEACDLSLLETALDDRLVYRKLMVIVNEFQGPVEKNLLGSIAQQFTVLLFPDISRYPVSEHKLTEIKDKLFWALGKILVFTKKPGEAPDLDGPLVLNKDATVADVAEKLHRDFARKFKFVKVTGSTKFAGQMVSRNYVLKNNDIIEIYS